MREEVSKKILEEAKDVNSKRIAEYVVGLKISEEVEDEIMKGWLNITEAMALVSNKAKSKAICGCAMIEDTEVFEWVREYFKAEEGRINNVIPIKKKREEFDIDLDDLFV